MDLDKFTGQMQSPPLPSLSLWALVPNFEVLWVDHGTEGLRSWGLEPFWGPWTLLQPVQAPHHKAIF